MANNLKAAAEAMRKLGPKKQFKVEFEESNYCEFIVKAVDAQEARDLAWDKLNAGEANWTNNGASCQNTEEI